MPPVIRVEDQTDLVQTSLYPYAKFPFDKFNQVQSRVFEFYDKETSAVIAAATSAGKTVVAEMFLAHEIRKRGGKGMYLAPLRALAQEKIDDWTDKEAHHFGDRNISICTGDYRLTPARHKELEQADLVLMTSEMLNSRCRNFNVEKNGWLADIGTLVVDECVPPSAMIETDQGLMPIGKIVDSNIDVRVASFNHTSGKVEYKKILRRQKKLLKRKWHTLYYKGGCVSVTENHLVWCEGRGYTPSKLVKEGDVVYVRANFEGEAGDFGDVVGRRLNGSLAARQISEAEGTTVSQAEGFSRVEVQRVETTGWHPAKNRSQQGVREGALPVQHEVFGKLAGDSRTLLSARQEEGCEEVAGQDNGAGSVGRLAHGRRQSRQESDGNTHRRFLGKRSSAAFGLALEQVGSLVPSFPDKELLDAKVSFRGEGQVSRLDSQRTDSRDDLQGADSDGGSVLLYVRPAVPCGSQDDSCATESFVVPQRWVSGEMGQDAGADEDLGGEESWCCDLEVEDNNNFFADRVLVHNSHLLTVPGRGDHLEAGLMKFTKLNPKARLVFLSATMPNVDEISDWITYTLTGKETRLLVSTYRPCPLNIHYEKYYDGEGTYERNELQKVETACQIVDYYPEDKFLVFVHTKRTGELMKHALQRHGVQCEFHNADLDKAKRTKLEKQFKQDPKLRVIVATSTLAWGLNLPARRVIVLGVHRGMSDVATYDVFQMVGRAGRPAFDPIGDAYILVPEREAQKHKDRLRTPQPIRSQMLEDVGGRHKTLAFHLISEIHQGLVQTQQDVYGWYKRTLASFQSKELPEQVVLDTIELLKKCGAVWQDENGLYSATSVGKVASMFYFTPFDVADLRRNFNNMFEKEMQSDDYWLSMAIGNIDTLRCGICNRMEREQMGLYANEVKKRFPGAEFTDAGLKAGFAYFMLLNGHNNNSYAGFCRGLQFDFPRVQQVLKALDSFTGKWGKQRWLDQLGLRVQYGVKGEIVYLCQLPHIGKAKAQKLWNAGIRTIEQVAANPQKVKTATGLKAEKVDDIIVEAGKLTLLG